MAGSLRDILITHSARNTLAKCHESLRLSQFMERVEVCPSIISSVLVNEFEVGGECLPREVVRLMRHGRDELS